MSQHPGTLLSPELRDCLLKTIPHLRAFAISLAGNADQADDLVQEAIVRGLGSLHKFETGTNFPAWLFAILRNQFHSAMRRKRREVEDPEGMMAGMLATLPEQHGNLELEDLKTALAQLSLEQREVLLLIGAEGWSYEETAQICGVKIGTIKSRVNRARARLASLLELQDEEDLGPDRVLRAVLCVEETRRSDAGRAPYGLTGQTSDIYTTTRGAV
ncbi:sigma-70 family RNA polymerase sigma factor [Microvirga massiliensis]|uniref:sigma-70 family RNA polymerase sigma factor n=1 Tax=Microvirga massiliensis TaxID=1033741 RepID=UPI0007C67F81|nr:sigma-70 family RNA polymerase sigma factor [Microvirga massiliensis]